MRLDKWLKVSRIIKRRTLAKEVCDGGRVAVNGRPAKASTELKVGDVVAVNFGSRILRGSAGHPRFRESGCRQGYLQGD